METKHTPGPWMIEKIEPYYFDYCWHNDIHAAGYGYPAKALGRTKGTAQANAEFIVRACNAHDDLLAALKEVASNLEEFMRYELNSEASAALINARAAIARAEGKE